MLLYIAGAKAFLSADFILAQDKSGLAPAVGVGGKAEVPLLHYQRYHGIPSRCL